MRSRWKLMLGLALGTAPLAWSAEKVTEKAVEKSADEKAEDAYFANRMVISALEAEVKGDLAARERLLNEAAQLGVAPIAQAHLGLINVGAKKPDWKTIDESMAVAAKDEKLLLYEKVRRQSSDNAAGHLAMANWCLTKKMEDQARAHLSRLLDFAPDHAGAREALGFVRLSNKWLSPQEIERMQANAVAKTHAIEKHGKTIVSLIEKMKSQNTKERATALAAFMAFKEPTAVGAVETALNTPDVPTTKLLLEWMGQVDSVDSSLILTRYALMHPDEAMRTLASEKLVTRPLHDFVPEILKMLSSPITMMVQPSYDRQGRMTGYRQAFGREEMGEKDIKVFAEKVQRNPVFVKQTLRPSMNDPQPNARRAAAMAAVVEENLRLQAEQEVLYRKLEMERQNVLIKDVNERIAVVVAKVSGKPLTQEAEEMWKWWDTYNETEYQKYKPERYRTTTVTCSIPHYYSCSCFAAGTPVVTQTGPMAIETIRAGDLVLNKDLQTGELNWHPVLKATVRTPSPMMALTFEGETIRCTNSHLFWVSGVGWKKASELKPGNILHGAKTPSRIIAVEAQPNAETYNLEVADAPNYFVGKQMLLTHDVTPLEVNRQTFPGQELVRQLSEQRPVKKTASR
jgi:hypothetical protein